ncbi:MAG: aldo/keto reductase [Clostridia bacterium]|nr:aldo/keto reductase [Eubacteriales bacterium]NCC47856.1 aldo/keto reductase [Clostridia bacterium]
MLYRTLGRTGLRSSVIALGTGGFSRIGQGTGKTETDSVNIVRQAIDNGINLVDSSELYGTEALVGQALSGISRDQYILSTKGGVYLNDRHKSGADLMQSLEDSLVRLKTDFVDIYHLHAVKIEDYDYVVSELVPALIKLKEQGKIRFTGITEGFASDAGHAALGRAARDEFWDVMMVGFNLLNQSARQRVLQPAAEHDIGTLDMFAVRRALISFEQLRPMLQSLKEDGLIEASVADAEQPLSDLMEAADCSSLTELAYRFCVSEPNLHVILSGTGDPDHLHQNIRDIQMGPLPADVRNRLIQIFAAVDTVSGQ